MQRIWFSLYHVVVLDFLTRRLLPLKLAASSQVAANQDTTEMSTASAEQSEAKRPLLPKKTWGVLTIVPGSIADAPRRIELWKDKTKLGRDPRRTFKDLEKIVTPMSTSNPHLFCYPMHTAHS